MRTLLIDADDTLWENNIFYEDCFSEFGALMAHQGFDKGEAEHTADAVERERIPVVGYAVEEFARSLVMAYEQLCERYRKDVDDGVAASVMEIGMMPADYPIVLLEGVEETLEQLSQRFRLILVTKGDPDLQTDKLRRSGLGRYFAGVHVVAEKDVDVYRTIVAQYELVHDQTWMVGNSPRSDINPAVEAGIGAVYVPHSNTWTLEVVDVAEPEKVVVLHRFSDLIELFAGAENAR
ncbi:MAG: HAD family hydrolase [Anaerolineae bacterium]|jgi:putative hydrolase of the HAD superfamily